MSLLGFDAIGRFAIGQNPFSGIKVVYSFSAFDPTHRPRNLAIDWIANATNNYVTPITTISFFSSFESAKRPKNFALDWIANLNVKAATPSVFLQPFSAFEPARHPHNFAVDWTANAINNYVTPAAVTVLFSPFSVGLHAKFWSGQQPQWWPNYFKSPLSPPTPSRRDTHDGDWIPRHRHPSVYSQEYYDQLRKKIERTEEEEEFLEELLDEIRQIAPNLLIPLSRLIPPAMLPTLAQLPPYRPVPTLTMNPPPFRMTTPEEMASDDEMIIRMLLEE